MKRKIIIGILLFSISIFYSFKEFTSLKVNTFMNVETSNPSDSFLLGAMHNFSDSVYTYLSDTLGFNIWHKYTVPNGWGWPIIGSNSMLPSDQLDTPVYRYSTDIRQRISLNKSKNLMSLLDRPKFEYLAFGQRSDYQCEKAANADPDYWFYTYYNDYSSTGTDSSIRDVQDFTYGNGEYVKRCLYTQSPGSHAQMLFDSLKGNMEQINTHWGVTWLGDSHYDWYIMPRIRIDSSFANNLSNQDVEVCKVIIKNRDGDSLTQVIKVKNFKSSDTARYLGNYLEQYFSRPQAEITNLIITDSAWFNDSAHISFGDTKCRVDFKVFWYDKCNMWIDRIRVENEPAHEMMTLNLPKIEEWIRAEVQDIAMAEINNGPYKFYIEEFEMNHLPCIGYLNKKIIQYSGGELSLMVNYNHDLVKAFIPNSYTKLFSPAQVKKFLIDSAELKEIFTICYNLEGWETNEHQGDRESYVPTTLYDGPDYEIDSGLVVYTKTPAQYDEWLQEHFDNYPYPGLNLKHIFQFSDSISRLGNVPFLYMPQAHLWIGKGHMLKEPSNEEITLTTNLAISYGAKGIMYFSYGSSINPTYDTLYQGSYHEVARGLANTDNSPRRLNVYGQNKWEAIKSINKKIKKWDEHLMSFDTSRKSFILRSEYSNLYSQTYFSDVITYRPFGPAPSCIEDNPNSSVSGAYYECKEDRYLQVATFQNSEPNTKYFMIVNRRCSPFINDSTNSDNNGGRRYVKIKLDSLSSYFAGFNNWSIYNVENDSLIKTFDKNTRADINLEWFLPGEGRLYKIAPVMQEGGTLVTNEEVFGTFDCNGEVNNGGKNITLKPATTIHFTNSNARIKMNGGNFKSGYSAGENTLPVYLKSKTGNFWKGMVFQNCERVEMLRTHFENISPYELDSTYAADLIDCIFMKIDQCSFSSEPDLDAGGIRAHLILNDDANIEAYIFNSDFEMDAGSIPALSFIASDVERGRN